jgi:nucleoside-diphosphate-sugar epimerase
LGIVAHRATLCIVVSSPSVAVTGASGLLGQRLLPLLDAGGFGRVVGLDVRDPARQVRHLQFHRVDVSGGDLRPVLEGVDVVVHLAAIVGSIPDTTLMERVNVEGFRRVLDAAAAVGVRKVVRASSAAVYGAWPNNPVPLSEDAPLRPSPGYAPAAFDAECERLLVDWSAQRDGRVASRLRLAPVVGTGAQTLFAHAVVGQPPVVVRGAAPPVQVLHLDDAAGALALAATSDLDGAYNVGADGWLSHEDALALVGRRQMPGLPYEAAQRVLAALWATGFGDAPPSVLPYLVHPWVVANDRIKRAGWQPRHTNEEALLLAAPADTNALPWAAAVGALLAGMGGTTWWLTRRRRRRAA